MQLSWVLIGGHVWLLNQSFGPPGRNQSALSPHAGLTWMRKGVALCWERAGKEIPLGCGFFCHANALSCYRGSVPCCVRGRSEVELEQSYSKKIGNGCLTRKLALGLQLLLQLIFFFKGNEFPSAFG